MPSQNEIKLDRRAIAIKIDNHPQARPQSGVMDADTVIEMQIKANRKRNRRAERNKRNHAAQQAGYYYAGVAEERREVRDAN